MVSSRVLRKYTYFDQRKIYFSKVVLFQQFDSGDLASGEIGRDQTQQNGPFVVKAGPQARLQGHLKICDGLHKVMARVKLFF